MSVDINWKTLTGGSDGHALAETIREFVHERFQQIALPKLIRSVKVHSFDFGSIAPKVVLKDICDPLPDFYETDGDDDASDGSAARDANITANTAAAAKQKSESHRTVAANHHDQTITPGLTRGALMGGGPTLGYFHPAFSAGFSGTNTPLAAVAGAHFNHGPYDHAVHHHHSGSFDSGSPPATATPPSRPTSRDPSFFDSRRASAILDGQGGETQHTGHQEIERNPEDMQVVFHVTYSGDVQLSMTAEVVLDYPMPSFVGIPLKLRITGITFNGVGIIAHIKKRAHLCFLSPDDAEALVGSEGATVSPEETSDAMNGSHPQKVGGLLEEIKIESEMGETEEGKQVLKNVGKIEKFILEQVQRLFEEEFVYPSFWTFLV